MSLMMPPRPGCPHGDPRRDNDFASNGAANEWRVPGCGLLSTGLMGAFTELVMVPLTTVVFPVAWSNTSSVVRQGPGGNPVLTALETIMTPRTGIRPAAVASAGMAKPRNVVSPGLRMVVEFLSTDPSPLNRIRSTRQGSGGNPDRPGSGRLTAFSLATWPATRATCPTSSGTPVGG